MDAAGSGGTDFADRFHIHTVRDIPKRGAEMTTRLDVDTATAWWQGLDEWEREAVYIVFGGNRLEAYRATRRFEDFLAGQSSPELLVGSR